MHHTKENPLTLERLAGMKPEEVAKTTVDRDLFFALTPLAQMTVPEAAATTYDRWLMTGRVKERRVVKESVDGLEDDKVEIYIEARYINAENRRANVTRRKMEAMRADGYDVRPIGARR